MDKEHGSPITPTESYTSSARTTAFVSSPLSFSHRRKNSDKSSSDYDSKERTNRSARKRLKQRTAALTTGSGVSHGVEGGSSARRMSGRGAGDGRLVLFPSTSSGPSSSLRMAPRGFPKGSGPKQQQQPFQEEPRQDEEGGGNPSFRTSGARADLERTLPPPSLRPRGLSASEMVSPKTMGKDGKSVSIAGSPNKNLNTAEPVGNGANGLANSAGAGDNSGGEDTTVSSLSFSALLPPPLREDRASAAGRSRVGGKYPRLGEGGKKNNFGNSDCWDNFKKGSFALPQNSVEVREDSKNDDDNDGGGGIQWMELGMTGVSKVLDACSSIFFDEIKPLYFYLLQNTMAMIVFVFCFTFLVTQGLLLYRNATFSQYALQSQVYKNMQSIQLASQLTRRLLELQRAREEYFGDVLLEEEPPTMPTISPTSPPNRNSAENNQEGEKKKFLFFFSSSSPSSFSPASHSKSTTTSASTPQRTSGSLLENRRRREKERKKEMLKDLLDEMYEVEMARQNSLTVLQHNMGYRLSREDVEFLINEHVQYELAVKRLALEELVWVGIVRDEGHLRLHRQLDGGYAATILPVTEPRPFDKSRLSEWEDRFSSSLSSTYSEEEEFDHRSADSFHTLRTRIAEILHKWSFFGSRMEQQQRQEEEERRIWAEVEDKEVMTHEDIMEEMFTDKPETGNMEKEKEKLEKKEEKAKLAHWRDGWKRRIIGRWTKKEEVVKEEKSTEGTPTVLEQKVDEENREWSQNTHQKQRDSASFTPSAPKLNTPPFPTSYASSSPRSRPGAPRDHFSSVLPPQSSPSFGKALFWNSPSLSLAMKEDVIVLKKPSSSPIRWWWTKWVARENPNALEKIENTQQELLDMRKQTLFSSLRKAIIRISTTRSWLLGAIFLFCGVFFVLL